MHCSLPVGRPPSALGASFDHAESAMNRFLKAGKSAECICVCGVVVDGVAAASRSQQAPGLPCE